MSKDHENFRCEPEQELDLVWERIVDEKKETACPLLWEQIKQSTIHIHQKANVQIKLNKIEIDRHPDEEYNDWVKRLLTKEALTWNEARKLLIKERSQIIPPKIISPPGSRLLRLTDLVFSPTSQKQIFEPMVADWHEEYFEALRKGESRWKFYFINARYYWAYAKATGLDTVLRAVKKVFKLVS